MRGFDYESYDALGLAFLLRTKQIGESELAEFVIGRIEALNPTLNAVSYKFYDKGREQIRRGTVDGPFKGVPFLLKDIAADYAGTPSSQACSLYKDNVSSFTSSCVEKYLQAGLVILGKTTTSELGLVGHVESALHGPTRNPWSLAHSTGGSSGGAAAIVAARILPAVHGSDGGGSIRIPAAWSGVFGLKASRGRVPYGPNSGEGLAGFSAPSALSISVRDSAALLDVIAGQDPGASYYVKPPERPYLQEVGVNPGRLRIAIVPELEGLTLAQDARIATEKAGQLCATLGHHVETIRLPVDPRELRRIYRVITGVNMHAKIASFEKQAGRTVEAHEVEPYTWASYQAGKTMSGALLSDTMAQIQAVTRKLAPYFVEYDVIVTPTVGLPPITMGSIDALGTDLDAIHELLTHCFPMTQVFNMIGYPAASVPLHWTADGLPMGTQFGARWGREDILFQLAAQLEVVSPWANKRPTLPAAG